VYPTIFRIHGFEISSFGFLVAAAFAVAGWVSAREFARRGQNPELAWTLLLYAVAGGLLGGKLYYLVLHWSNTRADPWLAVTSRGGLVWYGGFLLAVAAVIWRVRRSEITVLQAGDAIAPALALAYAIGRLGCFFVGDDYGQPTKLPWGVPFSKGPVPSTADNLRQFGVEIPMEIPGDVVLSVHPTQLYEVVIMLFVFAILWRHRKHVKPTGFLLFLYFILAGTERFLVEILRAKDDRFFGALTLAQSISLALAFAGVLGISWLKHVGQRQIPKTSQPAA